MERNIMSSRSIIVWCGLLAFTFAVPGTGSVDAVFSAADTATAGVPGTSDAVSLTVSPGSRVSTSSTVVPGLPQALPMKMRNQENRLDIDFDGDGITATHPNGKFAL